MIIDPYQWHTVRVTDVAQESPDAVSIHTERPADYEWAPGQHAIMRVTLADGTKRLRQYSYANAPSATHLQFTITRSPQGEVSSWLIDSCTTSSIIEVSQAFTGPLNIALDGYKHIGMIAGGSGIAPMLSYMHVFREEKNAPARTLLYTTRGSSRCASEYLQPLPEENIMVRVSDVDGRFTDQQIVESLRSCDLILLCGSRQFVSALHDICHRAFPKTDIRAEAFSLT